MAAITSRLFENGTITGGDGFNSITGSPTIDTSSKIKGVNCARTNWASATNTNGVVSGLTASEFWIQFYFNVATYPNATTRIVQSSNGSTQWNITMTSAGVMTFRNNTTNLASSFMTASLNTTYRIGIRFKKESSLGAADGVVELYHATGDNAFGAADYSSSAYTMNTSANAISSVNFGQSNSASTAGDIYWDDIKLDDAQMPSTGSNTNTAKTVNITVTETFSVLKQVSKPITFAVTETFTMQRTIGINIQLTISETVTVLKNILKSFAFTSTSAVNKTSEIGKPIPITSTETVSLQRQIGKTITQVVTSVVNILFTLALYKTIEVVSSISSVIQKNIVKPIAVVEAVIVSPSKAFSRTIEILSTAIINSSVGRGYLQTIEVVASTSVAFDKTLNKVIAIIEGVTVDIQRLLSLSINVSISTPITLSVHKSIQLTKSFIANLSFIFSKSTLDQYVNVYIKRNVGTLTLILKNSVAALLGKNARTITIEGKNDDNN